MALADPAVLTYNAVSKNLNRVDGPDGFGSTYYLDDSANLMRMTLKVKHTVPATGKFPESHMERLDIDHIDATGAVVGTASVWVVMKYDGAVQNTTNLQRALAALLTHAIPANTDKILTRQS